MKKIVMLLLLAMFTLPISAQDDVIIEVIPVCTAEEIALIPILLVDSGFFLDFALIPFGPANPDGLTDTLQPMMELLAVRDTWVEAIVPNLPNCTESVQFESLFGDYLDQAVISIMSLTIGERVDESYLERADLEESRLQGMDMELSAVFEVVFADFDIETALQEQMAAREGED